MAPLGAPPQFREVHLRRLNIGTRLRLAFGCILLLVFIGSGVSFWHLQEAQKNIGRVSQVEQRMAAVLRIDNAVLSLMNQLHRAADEQERDRFEREAPRLLEAWRVETALPIAMIQDIEAENQRQRLLLDTLKTMVDTLPARVGSFIELANAGDWPALHARLRNQVDRTDDVADALVREIDTDLLGARKRLMAEMQGTQRRALEVLGFTGISSLLLAGLLGFAVTRSIARPLLRLERGTRALSEGQLGLQVEVAGADELARLAAAFNRTSRELEDLYARVRNSEAHFRSLIENASDLIIIVDRSGKILYASPSSARVLGVSSERLEEESLRDRMPSEEASVLESILGDGPESGESRSFEVRLRHASGAFRILEGVATNLLIDPNVSGIVVNARDVTERRAAEQELREREDQLRQAQKLEAIGLLAAGVAHDFNNLLTVINGYSDILVGILEPADQQFAYAKSIRDAGERAANLTRQLLAFGRKQLLHPVVLNLNEIVEKTAQLLRRLIGEDIDLVCRLDASIGGIEADQNQVHQVLMNLAANARDAMPRGGTLAIETSNVTLNGAVVINGVEIPPGRYVSLAVSDTGTGMDEATQQRIFEPFFTTKEKGKGTGLGLASVYGIVQQSGGHITVESAMSSGTCFRIYLPRVDRPAEASTNAAEQSLERFAGKEAILLVEDEPGVRLITSKSLRDCGYRVIEAVNAAEALELFAVTPVRVDLLLTDVVMPGMTGVELSKHLLARDSELKVIYVSGYADSMLLRQGEMVSRAAFLQKPYRPSELVAKVRETLGSGERA
jgi:PAS domain S-box-containing protein